MVFICVQKIKMSLLQEYALETVGVCCFLSLLFNDIISQGMRDELYSTRVMRTHTHTHTHIYIYIYIITHTD